SKMTLQNVTPERKALLDELAQRYPHATLLAELKKRGELPTFSDTVPDVRTDNNANPTPWAGNAPNPQAPNAPAQPQHQIDFRGQAGQNMNDDKGRQTDAYQRSKIANRGGKGAESYVDLDPITSAKSFTCEIHEIKLSPMVPVWMPNVEAPDHLLFVRLAQ